MSSWKISTVYTLSGRQMIISTGVLVDLCKYVVHEKAQFLGRVLFALKVICLRVH